MKKLLLLLGILFAANAIADNNSACSNSQDCYNSGVYIYEGGQDLVDLYNMSGTTNLNAGDDQYSSQVSLGMEWNRWGQTWSHARMSTNGCLNLRSGSAGGNSANCLDFTPQSLPYKDYTLYPLWTDLIRGTASGGQTSKMLFKDFGDYAVFGWYYLREFQRSSSNSFEAILYANNSYEFRYRELDIINHDVVIGEQGKHSTTPEDTKTFLYYNDGQSGYVTLDTYLAGYGGPDIENGGSLYSGTEAQMCEINALYVSTCSGYAAAYLGQQCAINSLYNSECTGYAAAYLLQQCGLNTLYDESCTGYTVAKLVYECDLDVFYSSACDGYSSALAQQQALEDAIYETDDSQYGYDDGYDEYGNEEYDSQYGYDDNGTAYTADDMWYDEEYDEYLDPNDPCYENACEGFTDADWYSLDIEQFGQEQVDEWYGEEVVFSEEGYADYGTSTEEEYWEDIDEGMDTYDQEQDALRAAEEEMLAQEEEQRMLEDAEMLAQEEEYWAQEETFYAPMEAEEDLYAYEIEEFEPVGEDIEFSEEVFLAETPLEELYEEEFYEAEVIQERPLLAQNLIDQEIYILEETIGVEIFVEEEWEPVEENEIHEEKLEEIEREEEIYLEDDKAFEDLIDEDELEELINEEDEEEFFKEEKVEENKSTRFVASSTSPATIVTSTEQTFTVMVQQEQQPIQQAVVQDSSSSSTQAVVAAIDFGGTQEEQVTVAEVLQEQLDDGSGSSTGNSFDSNSYSSGSSVAATSSEQQQITQSTGNTFVVEQQEQSTGQVQIQVAEIVDSGPAVTAFEVAEQQEQQQEEQQELTFDDGSNFTVADQNFESSFDDALGTGQSIGQFLSNAAPDFAKFEVEAPTFQEQRQSSAVESLADSVSSTVIATNLQTELNKLQQDNENTNDYGDQTIVVSYIGYSSGFSEYTSQTQLADKQSWYDSSQVYKGQKTVDNVVGFYRMAGRTQEKLQEMIHSQYNR